MIFTLQKFNFTSNFTPKTSVNTNQIFENFGFYLPKFFDIETGVSTVYFSKNSKKIGKYFSNFSKETVLEA
jgi:hypothetical protein